MDSLLVPPSPRSRVRSAPPNQTPPTSPFRTSFVPTAQARTRAISSTPHVPLHPFPASGPDISVVDTDSHGPPRRHSRLHSRNLSIFFPRPQATISEDDRPGDEEAPPPPPDPILFPASQSDGVVGPTHDLNPGFTFGGLPKSISEPNGITSGVTARRGHHHKHSLSHNFFSFLEPGQLRTVQSREALQTAPTPSPVSQWMGAHGDLVARTVSTSPVAPPSHASSSPPANNVPLEHTHVSATGTAAMVTAVVQFALGALLWTRGQSIGSLACTGLGYWVVFDALGVAGPVIIARQLGKRPNVYGPARRGTTLLFAQCVYLMFAGIYVAKEAVEHLLLSAGGNTHGHGHGGGGDGHHHHWGDENPETLGLRFPVVLICLVLVSLIGTSAVFGQHDVLVGITNKHIPLPLSFRRSSTADTRGTGERILGNPYALPPILFCLAILAAEIVLDVAHYAPFDLALAALEVIVTAHVAFAACVVLGGVLLQTAPPMVAKAQVAGRPAGQMAAFWRAVREIERHAHVVHVPAPHVWQVVPPGQPCAVDGEEGEGDVSPALVVTLAPHVSASLPDADVLALTQWARARVAAAFVKRAGCVEVQVTVGVVRA